MKKFSSYSRLFLFCLFAAFAIAAVSSNVYAEQSFTLSSTWRGYAPISHPAKWYGWHNVKGVREYFPNLSIIPPFTMGAPSVPGKEYHAIYVIDADNKLLMKKVIGNIGNALNDPRIKGHIKIELLAFSPGIHIFFKNNGFEKALLQLKKKGVELTACANTLYELSIPAAKLYPFIKMVPSGQGEIILRESEGYAYLKP